MLVVKLQCRECNSFDVDKTGELATRGGVATPVSKCNNCGNKGHRTNIGSTKGYHDFDFYEFFEHTPYDKKDLEKYEAILDDLRLPTEAGDIKRLIHEFDGRVENLRKNKGWIP